MRNSGSGKRMVLAAALLAALALALPVSAQAGKGGDHLFGASGTGAGQFDEPADIAVNYATVADGAVDPFGSSVDGYRYVTDVENHRIQVFGPDDSFRFTFGAGVNLTSGGDLCPRPGFPSDACGKGSTSETRGGALNGPTGIGVNQVTGDVYVRDTLNNRVQVFSAAGTFERAWGWDVIKAGQPNDVPGSEQQTVSLDSSFAQEKRDFILSFRSGPPGTVPIPYNASASQVQAALEAYGPIGSGNVEVTSSNLGGGSSVGGPWTIDFKGGLANVDVPQLMGRFTSEPTPTKYVEITTTVPGAGFEICDVDDGNVASDCKASPGFTTAGGGISRAFKDGTGLAIHQPTGDVFVIDPGTSFADNLMPGRIQQFEADGAFVAAFGTRDENGLRDDDGEFVSTGTPRDVAVDSDGIVYAEDGSGILRFDSVSGDTLPFYDLSLAIGSGANVVSLEIDPQTDDLLVLVTEAGVGPEGSRIVELDTSGNPAGASPSQLLSTHLPDAPVALNGLAIDPASDVFLLSWGFSNRILVLDDDGAQPPPAAALDEPAGVGVHQATLSGTVNPNGSDFPTRYRFEYARTDGEWQAASDFVDIGNGVVPQAVGPETITDLEANAAYKARLFAKRAFGAGTDISAERTFSTPKAPPEAATGAAQQVSATSAYLLGTINPNNLPSKYRFEYGTTAAYGSSVPVPDGVLNGGRPQAVGEAIGGLQPATTYHYRLVAESSEGAAVPQGQNRTFTTRPAVEPPPGRAYEMVTPPDKVNRRGGHNEPSEDNQAYPGIAAPDGESLMFAIFAAILDPEGGTSFPHALDFSVIRRSPQGWRGEAFTNLASIPPASAAPLGDPMGFSKDFDVSAWYHAKFIFPSSSPVGVKVFSDVGSGGYLNSGWYDWIGDPTIAAATGPAPNDPALVDDEGERVLKWSRLYRGLLGPSDPSHKQLAEDPDTSEPEGGGAIYMQEPPGSGAKHLVNECTSTGGFTQLPRRSGTASATDVIAVQNCQPGSPTSVRGAVIGSTDLVFRAMSDDGKRVFFTSPDPASGPAACTTALNAATDCPAQLFVRQYGSGAPGSTGPATVRWISRPRVSGTQRINLLRPALYQGASADGRYVFFKSEAPLTDDDPNGGNSITSGPASPNSWDLYRYEMPAGNDGVHGTADDVDADPGTGTLTRVTRGETGTAEPNLSDDGALDTRYISEDGERVYFVTPAPFAAADADNAPPAGSSGTNVPAGSAAATETRNLYLYDEGESGAARWKFVAHLGTTGVDGCATRALVTGPASKAETRSSAFSCIRATPDGGALVFESARRLTEDDVDTAADVYLYDAGADELVRISAPPVGVEPYLCEKTTGQTCNADLGMMIEMPVKGFGLSGFANYNLAIDAAGELSIFFESRSSLVPEDTNGSFWDTYRWRAGELSLISPGNSPDHAWYSGNSEDGQDVFFQTTRRIDPREIEDADIDINDARVGGGFPLPTPPPACDVLAGSCSPPPSGPPPGPPAGSAALLGGGNVKDGARKRKRRAGCAKRKIRRKGRCVKRAKGRKRAGRQAGGRR